MTVDLVEAVARRVVEILREEGLAASGGSLVDAQAVAEAVGRTRAWVYAHADELGAVRLGEGERPRLGFDVAEVRRRLTTCRAGRTSPSAVTPVVPRDIGGRDRRAPRAGTRWRLIQPSEKAA